MSLFRRIPRDDPDYFQLTRSVQIPEAMALGDKACSLLWFTPNNKLDEEIFKFVLIDEFDHPICSALYYDNQLVSHSEEPLGC